MQIEIPTKLPKNNDQLPISVFLSTKGRRVRHKLCCIACGLPTSSITGVVQNLVDNPGPAGEHYVEIQCKRCSQLYRLYTL